MTPRTILLSALAGLAVLAFALSRPGSAEPAKAGNEFARSTIDLGCVVSDVDRAVDFYTNAVGFKEIKGFSAPAELCTDAGLTNGKPLDIRVLVLGDGDSATKLKLMAVPGVDSKKSDNQYIHSQLGYSYLTIFVNDIDQAMARLKKAGVKPVAKGPVALPKGFPEGIFLAVVRDPDGNLVELVGPKKQ